MNCRPNQLAWISVPPSHARGGIEQLDRQVVRTVRLQPRSDMPMWEITPQLSVTITGSYRHESGPLRAGDRLDVTCMPDAWLRPFDDESIPLGENANAGTFTGEVA